MNLYSQLNSLQAGIAHVDLAGAKKEGRGSFFGSARYAVGLALEEKEIIFFGLLQWVAVLLGYLLWIEVLNWLPLAMPDAGEGAGVDDLLMWGWLLVCVVLVALPVSVLTGAMAAAHFFRRRGHESTVVGCMGLALRNLWRLWAFHVVDGLITVQQLIRRVPSKSEEAEESRGSTVAAEATYYVWKVASAAVLPTFLLADSVPSALKASAAFLRAEVLSIAKLRAAYSAVCWALAVVTAVGIFGYGRLVGASGVDRGMYEVYLSSAAPLGVALAVLMIVLRPIYILSLCELYSGYVDSRSRAARSGPATNQP